MLSVDLLVWLLIVGLVTVGWSLKTSRDRGEPVPILPERRRDITPVLHLGAKDFATA